MSFSNGLGKCPKLRFPGFDELWETKPLGSLGTFTKGAPLSKADISLNGTPLILYGELYTTYSEVTYIVNRKTDQTVAPEYYSRIGDVIIPTSGETAEDIATATCVMVPGVILAGDLNIFRTVKVDGRIVSYIIKNKVNRKISSLAQGKSVVHISAAELAKINISFPSKAEQRKILELLKLLDDKIAKQSQFISIFKKYKRGVMRAIFRDKALLFSNAAKWESVRLDNECTFFSGGTPKSTDSRFYGGTIPFIRSGEIHGEKTELFLTDDGLKYSSAKTVSKGDLILALYGATSGEVDIAKIDGAINQAILCIRPSRINRTFLKYLLEDSQDDILNTYLQGGQGNLSAEIIKNLVFEIPDEQSQSKVVIFLSAIDQRIISSCVYVEKLTEFRSGLLQKLFI